MKPKMREATDEEKAAHDGLYPLHSVITWGNNLTGFLEDLRPRGDTQFEVVPPITHHFFPGELHGLLCHDMADAIKRLNSYELVPCKYGCHL